jgi:hypothetical protein
VLPCLVVASAGCSAAALLTPAPLLSLTPLAGRKQLPRALELFVQGLTAPTLVCSAITAAVYKKFVLVSLIHSGEQRCAVVAARGAAGQGCRCCVLWRPGSNGWYARPWLVPPAHPHATPHATHHRNPAVALVQALSSRCPALPAPR